MFSLKEDAWLNKSLNKRCYQLILSGEQCDLIEAPLREQLESLPRPHFVYAKVPTDKIGLGKLLLTQGFYLVDTNITLSLENTAFAPTAIDSYSIQLASESDRGKVKTLASTSFSFSRFHLDPYLSLHAANQIKARWVSAYFTGERGDRMYIARTGSGEIIGFLMLIQPAQKSITIDLVAVCKKHRGQGVAKSLIDFARTDTTEIQTMRVGTQIANTTSVRFYEKYGFILDKSNYVYHRHG